MADLHQDIDSVSSLMELLNYDNAAPCGDVPSLYLVNNWAPSNF